MIWCPHHLTAEHAKGASLGQKHLDAFAADNVSALSLARTWREDDYSFVLRDRVTLIGSDRFEFARHSEGAPSCDAFTFVVCNREGPADIVAWRPPLVALWLGRVALLGEEQVLGPRLGEPLLVHDSVTAWFAARREGVFVVDHAQAAWMLRNETLGVETAEHARALRKHLTIAAPPIRVFRSPNVDNIHERDRSQILYNVQDKQGAAA